MKSFKSFKEWLFPNFFTQYHKEADTYKVNGKGILERFVEICGEYFDDEVTPDIDNILNTLIDYDHNSAIYINYLWEMFGNFPYAYGVLVGLEDPTPENIQRWISEDTNYPRANYRKLMQYVLRLYKIRGSAEFFEIVARFFDVKITIEELTDFVEDESITDTYDNQIVNLRFGTTSNFIPISIDFFDLKNYPDTPIVFDTVNLSNKEAMDSTGFTVSGNSEYVNPDFCKVDGVATLGNWLRDKNIPIRNLIRHNGQVGKVDELPDTGQLSIILTLRALSPIELQPMDSQQPIEFTVTSSHTEEVTYPLISESGDDDGNVIATYNTNYDHDWDPEVSYGSQVSSSYIDKKMVWGETNCNRCDKVKVTIGYPISRIQWFKDQDPDGDGSKIKEATNQAFRKLINKFLPIHVIIAEWGEEVFGYNLTPATVNYDSLPGSITSGEITLTLPNY